VLFLAGGAALVVAILTVWAGLRSPAGFADADLYERIKALTTAQRICWSGVVLVPVLYAALLLLITRRAGLGLIAALVVPMAGLMFHVELLDVLPGLLPLLVLGIIGIAATGTLFGVMTVRTRARDLVLASVLLAGSPDS
jgi:hypothetical protein